MYYLFMFLQAAGICVASFELLYVANQRPSRQQQILLILVLTMLINFAGYTFELTRNNQEEALLAVRFIYFGKPYIVYCLLLFVLEVCHVRMKDLVRYSLLAVHIFINVLVETCSYNDLFYSSISYTTSGYFPHLVLGHGIVYVVYTTLVLGYIAYITFISIRSLCRSANEQEKTIYRRLLSIGIVSVVMLMLYLSGVTGGYDTTLLAYLYGTVVLSRMFFRDHLFDTLVLAKELALDTMSEGFIVVNNTDHIIYYNDKAARLYPQIKDQEETDLIDLLDEYILQNDNIRIENNVYSVTSRLLQKDRSYLGKIYTISDITDNYFYTRNVVEQTKIMKKLKDQAEMANREKTAFIGKMVNEIQEPMQKILDLTDDLRGHSGENKTSDELQKISDSAGQLLEAVENLTDYVK